MNAPELSLIIPALNEREQLPELLCNLAAQTGVALEVLVADGGSTDGSLEWLQAADVGLPLQVLQCPTGRGRQMNLAAQQARGEWLLFLHADSRFVDPQAIRRGIDRLCESGCQTAAGHFALCFARSEAEPSFGYYFYEWKARLGREETIHGDQGFLLRRTLYEQVGPFREDLPVMEDTDFAERLREVGHWLLLPAEISTSARRFEEEGLWQRQLLNALLMYFRSIDFKDFFAAVPEVYQEQMGTGRLRVWPYFHLVRALLKQLSWSERWQIWWRCGEYVRGHAWQLAFALDSQRAFRHGVLVGQGKMLWTRTTDSFCARWTNNLCGRLAATILVKFWFAMTGLWLRFREKT